MGRGYVEDLEKECDNRELEEDKAKLRKRLAQAVFADVICVMADRMMASHVQNMYIVLKHVESHLEQHDCFELECPECALLHEIRLALTKHKGKTA